MLTFNIAEKIIQNKEKKHEKQRWKTLTNFLLSSCLFLLLWSKQIILFMDLINLHNYQYQTFFTLAASSLARVVSLLLALVSFYLCQKKIESLRNSREDLNLNLIYYILLWYGLFQAIWVFFLFIEGKL